MKRTYLSLGSNVGNRKRNLDSAIERLGSPDLRVLRVSPWYETEPVDCGAQRWFLNLVVEAETTLFPMQLLARIHRIEHALGRTRTVPKGPRTLDIDILLYGDKVVRTTALEIPHPRLHERRFVLEPLADLEPALRHPVLRLSIRELLDQAPAQSVRPWSDE